MTTHNAIRAFQFRNRRQFAADIPAWGASERSRQWRNAAGGKLYDELAEITAAECNAAAVDRMRKFRKRDAELSLATNYAAEKAAEKLSEFLPYSASTNVDLQQTGDFRRKLKRYAMRAKFANDNGNAIDAYGDLASGNKNKQKKGD